MAATWRRWVRAVMAVGLVASPGVVSLPPVVANHFGPTLDLTPEVLIAPTETFVPATVLATLSQATEAPVDIDAEVFGGSDRDGDSPLRPDASCTVPAGRTDCPLVVPPPLRGGTVLLYAWVDRDGAPGTCEADHALGGVCQPNEGSFRTDDEEVDETTSPGVDAEPDQTDVVRVAFSARVDVFFDCFGASTTIQAGATATVTCSAESGGQPVSGARIDGEHMSGPNNGDGGRVPPPDSSNCLTPCAFTYTPTASGDDVFCFWIDVDDDDEVDKTGPHDGGGCTTTAAQGATPDRTDQTEVVRLRVVDENTPTPSPTPPDAEPCRATGASVAGAVVTGTSDNDVISVMGDCARVDGGAGKDRITIGAHAGTTEVLAGPGKDRICAANGSVDMVDGSGDPKDKVDTDAFDTSTGAKESDTLTCGVGKNGR